MKAGLFTYHFSDNYGALCQAYGLRQWLRERGIDAEFINYQPTYVEQGGPLDRPWMPSLWRKNLTILYMKQAFLRHKFFGDKAQHKLFESFRHEVLGVTGPRIRHHQDLAPLMSDYDMLVCGSDQIWNPSIQKGLDPVYFLDISGSDHAHKVAYAPSFGRSMIQPEYHADLAALVSKLDGVSVREKSGLDVLKAAGIKCEHVQVAPDPTVLLGNFDALLDDDADIDNSVFCYALRTDEVIRDVAKQAAQLSGGPLISPRSIHQRWSDIGQGVTPGPVEWLRMLARARVVVSNSFHGVALSVLLNRPFIAVGLPGKRAKMNTRVQSLLTIVGLTDRILDIADPPAVCALMNIPINWKAVNARLAAVRTDAEAYLDNHIAQAKFKQKTRYK
ncbi:polysaccharide pyruvyl transferase family protein [Chlorobium sp. N1]|uniref:polysaccharide pyruvyl transferase family protein n=1 Tax=Chlorobium sp. N1 TaxID=2491138 RepID=UPI00103D40B3|nr:polysaccharide pyruvyl transferase family protein [Chlorobium sp. N1]TCD47536.1 polysaccharide pyruvyl transferase family protein [Chlorobium sp. N1]